MAANRLGTPPIPDHQDHSKIFEPLLGKAPWNVKLGIGSFLTMDFGTPQPETFRGKSFVHGEWHLWIMHCGWRIENEGAILAASNDDHEQLAAAIEKLRLGSLVRAEVSRLSDLALVFAGGLRLHTFTLHSSDYEQWELFKPDGMVWVAEAAGKLVEKPRGGLGK